jgi:hypothetical protein
MYLLLFYVLKELQGNQIDMEENGKDNEPGA